MTGSHSRSDRKSCAGKHTPTGTSEFAHGSLYAAHTHARTTLHTRPPTHVTCAHVQYNMLRVYAHAHACSQSHTCAPQQVMSLKVGPGVPEDGPIPHHPQDVTPAAAASPGSEHVSPCCLPSKSGLPSAPLLGQTDQGVLLTQGQQSLLFAEFADSKLTQGALGPRTGMAEGRGCYCPSSSANVMDSSVPLIKQDQGHRVL